MDNAVHFLAHNEIAQPCAVGQVVDPFVLGSSTGIEADAGRPAAGHPEISRARQSLDPGDDVTPSSGHHLLQLATVANSTLSRPFRCLDKHTSQPSAPRGVSRT